ncbi:2-polyprenyl-6-methoxyphenol hydroxylase [Filimonas lacunae]|uniref:Flavin-dependent monooxygenase n=1 Tax=Filimonas lacunae TaxID=477680 RepID=A0A173MCS6_9BACT|nr:NAD(P)/FAD-dependent oxidoreductase [Filimonas lacunae]BAV05384.1 monooxygenase [Filimonas lacunae]SIT21573.1 2-polyprenyl-6-methoxyphenol hydroxylase [Filimonas lacunae]
MIIENKKIAIIGGGPGGLTLARLLQLKGANVQVYERDVNAGVRQQGATLDLHEESGLKALEQAGLMDAFKQYFRPGADKTRVTDAKGNIAWEDHAHKPEENFGSEYFRPEIDRGPLRDLLIQSLTPGTIVWDSRLLSQQRTPQGWLLQFENGTTATADIIIAADGANSKLRALVTPIPPFYSGVTAVEGSVYDAATAAPQASTLLQGGKVFAFEGDKCIILSSKGDGSVTFYVSLPMEEGEIGNSGIDFSNKASVHAWFTKNFTGWEGVWQELFENAAVPFVPRPINCMPVDQYWEAQPDITLLGDAAHLMPPFAGEGVNMAMQDALELSECLTSNVYGDVVTAIGAYEKAMRARAGEKARESLENTRWMHAEGALKKIIKIFGN